MIVRSKNMNREIKFRAWDKRKKRMYHLTDGSAFGIDYEVGIWNIGWELCEISANGKQVVCSQDSDVRDDGVLMQYTGLNDKNGKEIYEGDLLRRYTELAVSYGSVTVVCKWSATRAGFELIGADERGFNWGISQRQCKEKCEVIGNIYESPELLTLPNG